MTDILKDREFWARVGAHVTEWLAASPEKEHRQCWIDDFTPAEMRRKNPAAEVRGIAWLMRQGAGIECTFLAVIPWRIMNRDRITIEIESVVVDLEHRTLEVALSSSVQNA